MRVVISVVEIVHCLEPIQGEGGGGGGGGGGGVWGGGGGAQGSKDPPAPYTNVIVS